MKIKFLSKSEMKNIYGDDIRRFRDEKCLTQSYMAEKLSIGQSAYQKIETGTVKISMERLLQIANILSKPIESFLNHSISNTNKPLTEKLLSVSEREWNLTQKVILQQEKRILELEERIKDINKN